MNLIKYKDMVVVLVVVVLLVVSVADTTQAWTYKVRPGDSLWSIAARYGKSVSSIRMASGFWGNRIKPGQKLIIPSSSSRKVTSSELHLLARVVEAEAGGEPYSGKVGVAAVIKNRLRDKRFPNTIKGVIYQPHAFESVTNKLIWRLSPDQQSYNAVRDALSGWDPSYGAVFFWNPYRPVNPWIWSRPIITQHGNHVFAR